MLPKIIPYPFIIGGAVIHQVGLPWHYGWRMPTNGLEKSANLLTPATGDPNSPKPRPLWST